ncbi:MAG: FHS family L-fucose permease-like MFS transporter [Cyclobacteriaceae bacterium]|jgi:FHS family L-fucose permease-like MFS transporter
MAGAQPNTISESEPVGDSQNYTKPFITISFLFFMWGFITVMNDVLAPHLKAVFELSFFQAGLVQFAFFIAFFIVSLIYFLISTTSGDPITRIGYKKGIIIGLIICGAGCCLFYPAAEFQAYGFFLSALFVLATGVTILQIAANPYAAILGKPETASSRLNLAQGFNSIGTTLAPFIGALLIYKVFSDGTITVDSLKLPYIIYGSAFIVLALFVRGAHLPTFVNKEKILKGAGALKFRQLKFGMFAIFAYVGAEVAIGTYLINYFGLSNIMGFEEAEAGVYLSYYWGGAMIGRFLGSISMGSIASAAKRYGLMAAVALAALVLLYLVTSIKNDGDSFYMEFLGFSKISLFLFFALINYLAFFIGKSSPSRILAVFASAIIVLLLLVVGMDGYIAFWSAIAIGLFNSIMWSNIFTLAIKDLKEYTSQGSSLLVMMIVGGALVPPMQGLLADYYGVQNSFLLPILCYIYILFYALNGYKPSEK